MYTSFFAGLLLAQNLAPYVILYVFFLFSLYTTKQILLGVVLFQLDGVILEE